MVSFDMKLESFLADNKISLLPENRELLRQGIREMKQSTDILHPVEHIYRIFTMYEKFKKHADEEKIDPAVFLTAVVWHDVWKARLGTRNVFMTVYAQVMEGIMAAQLFRRESHKYDLDIEFVDKVAYAIRKHSQIQFLPLRTPDSKLLWDLDKLDKWDPARVKGIEDKFFAMKNPFWRFLFKLTMSIETERGIHFAWLKDEFKARKAVYFKQLMI